VDHHNIGINDPDELQRTGLINASPLRACLSGSLRSFKRRKSTETKRGDLNGYWVAEASPEAIGPIARLTRPAHT
jgi:hypothetical protein